MDTTHRPPAPQRLEIPRVELVGQLSEVSLRRALATVYLRSERGPLLVDLSEDDRLRSRGPARFCRVQFDAVYIKFIGTHAEYDKIDASSIGAPKT